jgi:hypothetical protein
MRIPARLWVQAYIRRMNGSGAFATVVRHGDDDLGTIWIKLDRLDGTAILLGPAPEPLDRDDERIAERRFIRLHKAETIASADADLQLARQHEFDSDLWVVEVEDRHGRHGLGEVIDPS